LCKHVHETGIVREVVVMFDFSWLVKEVMNGLGEGIMQIFSRWRFFKCDNNQLEEHVKLKLGYVNI